MIVKNRGAQLQWGCVTKFFIKSSPVHTMFNCGSCWYCKNKLITQTTIYKNYFTCGKTF